MNRLAWTREPAAWVGAVSSVLALLVAFGLDLTDAQVGAILAIVPAVMAVAIRAQVRPKKLSKPK